MATLTNEIDKARTNLSITDPVTTLTQGDLLRIDNEVVRFLSYGWNDSTRAENTGVWLVDRGVGMTKRTVHAAGIAVTAAADSFVSAALTSPPTPFEATGGASDAASVTYDNAESGLTAEDVQAALDELAAVPPGEGAQLLVDPGEVWEAEHVYSAGDRVFVDDTEIFETEDDGESGAEAPDWYTDMSDVIDNEIGWYWLGRVGDLSRGNLPGGVGGGLGEFALTSPSAIGGSVVVAIAAALAAQGLYTGVADPTDGGGLAAAVGSLYRDTSGSLWFKYAIGDTAWAVIQAGGATYPLFYVKGGSFAFAMPLPTADPVDAGVVWNDNGALKVSAGA